MKIRNGFVSNSSSSSFTIVTPKDYDYTKNIDDISLIKLYERAFPANEEMFDGKPVNVYYGNQVDGENTVLWCDVFKDYIYEKQCNGELNKDFNEKYNLAERLYEDFDSYFDNSCLKLYGES